MMLAHQRGKTQKHFWRFFVSFSLYTKVCILAILILSSIACMTQSAMMQTIAHTVTPTALPATTTPESTVTKFPTKTPKNTPVKAVCFVNTNVDQGNLNMRTCGAIDCTILTVLPENARLTLIEFSDWSFVEFNEYRGFVNSKFITCEEAQ